LERVFSIILYIPKAKKKAIRGETIQEKMIFKRDKKFTSNPDATPEPVRLPIISWWVERGNFFQLKKMINRADIDRDMLKIEMFTSKRSFPTVFITFWPCSIIPIKTKHPNKSIAFLNFITPEPIHIPRELDVSFEPIPKAMRIQAIKGINSDMYLDLKKAGLIEDICVQSF
jgi:hypothetical protein